ncbi:MAG: RNA polymerase sigma factor, partial [Planctomycetales bacterium]|nr:RNA polymerase sigma factor [Planctomycetales bacterium]
GAVHATACAVLGDPVGAEDIAQETFLAAYKSLGSLADRAGARAWLCGIARNMAVSEVRRRGRAAAALPRLPGRVPEDPGRTLAEREECERNLSRLREAIAALPERARQIVTLRYFGGLAYREIAETLGLSLDVVQVALFRAKQALGERMRKIRDPRAT